MLAAGAWLTMQVTLVMRYGLFLFVSLWFAFYLLMYFPITPDLSAWYAGTGLLAIGYGDGGVRLLDLPGWAAVVSD